MQPYFQDMTLLSTGLSPYGFFEVRIDQNTDMDKRSLINDIYEVIDSEAKDQGVNNVPVVFKLASADADDLESTPEELTEEMEETPDIEVKETPGFGFIYGILSVALVSLLARRIRRTK